MPHAGRFYLNNKFTILQAVYLLKPVQPINIAGGKMHAVISVIILIALFSAAAFAGDNLISTTGSKAPQRDSLSGGENNMTIEVNVPDAHTIETELGYVEDGGILFTRKNEVTVFGTIRTSSRIHTVKINGRKSRFTPEGDRYKFQRKIHLEDEYNTIRISVTDSNEAVKDMAFTIHRKYN